jgi:hypothetical protein
MRSERIEDILDRCLERIAAGEDMTACLRDEPEHADVLAPLLHAAVALRRWGSLCRTEEPPDLVPLPFVEERRNLGLARWVNAVKVMQHRALNALARMLGGRRGRDML